MKKKKKDNSVTSYILILIIFALIVGVGYAILRSQGVFDKSYFNKTSEEIDDSIKDVYNGTIIKDEKKLNDIFEINLSSDFKLDSESNDKEISYTLNSEELIKIKIFSVQNYVEPKTMMQSFARYYGAPAPIKKTINQIVWYNVKYGDVLLYSAYATAKDGIIYFVEIEYGNTDELAKYENDIIKGIKLK